MPLQPARVGSLLQRLRASAYNMDIGHCAQYVSVKIYTEIINFTCSQPFNQTINQYINQSIHQSINQSINRSVNQSSNYFFNSTQLSFSIGQSPAWSAGLVVSPAVQVRSPTSLSDCEPCFAGAFSSLDGVVVSPACRRVLRPATS